MNHPRSLTIVAVLFIVTGAFAAWEIVAALLHGSINLNIAVVGLFVGFGLLRHRPIWRTCALVSLWIFLALVLVATGVAVFGGRVPTHLRILAIVVGAIAIAVLRWMYRVLTSQEVKSLFEKQGK